MKRILPAIIFCVLFCACSSGNRIDFENGKFDILVQNIKAYDLILDMAQKNNITVKISPSAQKVLKNETVSLDAEEANIAETVQTLLFGFDLEYTAEPDGFIITETDESLEEAVLLHQKTEVPDIIQ